MYIIRKNGNIVQEAHIELAKTNIIALKARTNLSTIIFRDLQFTTEKSASEVANVWHQATVERSA